METKFRRIFWTRVWFILIKLGLPIKIPITRSRSRSRIADFLNWSLLPDLRNLVFSQDLVSPAINIGTARILSSFPSHDDVRKIFHVAHPNCRIRWGNCLFHNSLSSNEYAVMVSWPPRCSSRNGIQNACSCCDGFSPFPWQSQRIPTKTATIKSSGE